jgi:hypothetical protein
MVYRVGMKIKVNIIETERPPITVLAMGAQSSAPGPIPKAIGSKAKTVVKVVIRIGRSLLLAPNCTASDTDIPLSFRILM